MFIGVKLEKSRANTQGKNLKAQLQIKLSKLKGSVSLLGAMTRAVSIGSMGSNGSMGLGSKTSSL